MKHLIFLLFLCTSFMLSAQKKAYGNGEWFKFRVHYGFVTAGYATLEVDHAVLDGKQVHHVKGEGRTVGLSKLFFNVEDYYQSYIDTEKDIPYRFIRKINEGGHTKDIQIDFDHSTGIALVNNKKHNKKEAVSFPTDAQDMVSAFYYLRNNLDVSKIRKGETIDMNMFFDKENYKFRLKFLGREILDTKFGRVPCLKFRPYVQAGRVFKEKESLTVWVTDDDNKMPMLIKADLAVGSLKASLSEFKGLQHSFKVLMD
ncbi:DUF3108 domain-containing protein [Marixanthomonas spongiae]|uniref:DUF3108 domain-containing protein n=1 Tax=Marixanthomonas spongiae TaxID=2174845 RepID=A0A2U0HZ59_9FLAO|nr:DUF3108 domain-containing protein [Marixanthomonas spongiae]PVW14106.1 DUF3108 domain-containing protein [Marixanthomonas spongiae]